MPQSSNEQPKRTVKQPVSSQAPAGERRPASSSSASSAHSGERRPTSSQAPSGERRPASSSPARSGARRPATQDLRASAQKPRRRRRRKHMNPVLYILLVLAVSGILAGIGWVWAGDILALNKPAASAVITLPTDIFTSREVKGEVKQNGKTEMVTTTIEVADLDYVTDLLAENGLIEYKFLFKLFCVFTGVDKKGKLQPGTYELTTDMDYHALINSMSSSSDSRMTVEVMIPEGYTIDQIFALLEEKGVSSVEILQKVAATYDYKWDFLQGVLPLGDYHRLEGYLFPDTYVFYMGGGESSAVQVLNKMIQRLDELFTDELRAKAEEMGYSFHEMLTIASLIEKETDGEDQEKIASVIYNRLDNPTEETAGYLQIDAAIAYVTGRSVTQADYQNVDSPYNTYLYKGLTPGPICNPGMVAINSALNPESTKYYYYVLNPSTRRHEFSRTYNEHQKLVQAYSGNGNG